MKHRLVALTTSYPLHVESCAGVFIKSLYRNLPPDWTVDVVCPDDNRGSQSTMLDEPPIHRARYAPRSWQLLAQQSGGVVSGLRHAPWRIALVPVLLLALAWKCFRCAKRADLIHANWALCGVIAALVGYLRGIPVVTTLRGDDVTRAQRSMLERWILNVAVRGSRGVVCVSEAMATQLRARYPEYIAKIFTCLNGVDDAFFRVLREEGAPEEPIRIVAVGSLIPRKGYDVLIDAVAVMQRRDRVRVTIVGEGPSRTALEERMVQKGVAEQFKLIGEVSPAHIPELLADADVFVLVSRAEGRPNVVIEALASGLPVISSRLPGIEGLVFDGKNGWIVDVDDSSAVALALDHAILDSSERLHRGKVARDEMQKLGQTWVSTGAQYCRIFTDAMHPANKVKS